jgi:iron-sulfur cluster assembly accessory protein
MENNFVITEEAAVKLLELGKNRADSHIRLRIKVEGGGCSGFKYYYDFDSSNNPGDFVFHGSGGVEVAIDDISMGFLKDSELHYVEELGSAGFEIKSPNFKAKCGCGSSFAI